MSSSSPTITSQSHSHPAVAPIDTRTSSTNDDKRPPSPRAPAYSPITPKVQPVLPNNANQQQAFMPPPENGGTFTFQPPPTTAMSAPNPQPAMNHSHPPPPQPAVKPQEQKAPQPAIKPTEYIPPPPSQPFSAEDATDAIALRAAISALQFQKQKAERDIKTLRNVKEKALEDPATFKKELAAGRLSEQRPKMGDLRAILDEAEEGDSEDEVVLGASQEEDDEAETQDTREIPNSQPSFSADDRTEVDTCTTDKKDPFPRIPGPQNVVRMPYINWEKYHVVGEPLEAMHEQQRKWPGSAPFARDKGREYQIAAPYSPFLDTLEPSTEGARKDSAANSSSPGTETKRRH